MINYHELLRHIIRNGSLSDDRTGVGTVSVFGYQTRFSLLGDRFPLVTTKKIHFKSVAVELLWFLRGDTNIKYLKDNGVSIWDEWADKNGDLGPVYGKQWRRWEQWQSEPVYGRLENHPIDQIAWVINEIKTNPNSRRLVVSAWNPADLPDMAPCHCLFQFHVRNGGLSCHLYQRSADAFLGVPFNIASYALLTRMVAEVTGLYASELICTFGDLHLYSNHMNQALTLLSRPPMNSPLLKIPRKVTSIDDFKLEDFVLEGYSPYAAIPAPVAV